MNHFLARLGRSKVGEYFMPTVTVVATLGHLGYHIAFHDQLRTIFGASTQDGQLEQISDYMRDMIKEVFVDVSKAGFHEEVVKVSTQEKEKPMIRWFASSTLDPLVFGMADYRTGISIGVPSSYNYRKPEDLPDSLFQIKKLALMRSPQGGGEEKELLVNQEKDPAVVVRKIDRYSEEGAEFTDSLLLSDDAKRFSIARELFVADSYRPLFQTGNLVLSMMTAISVAKAHVKKFHLADRHVTQRMPGYALASALGIGLHWFLSSSTDKYVADKANRRARELGDKYRLGAEEFFNKQAKRDRLLGIKPNKLFGI